MRILVLHPSRSSSSVLFPHLRELSDRLLRNHGVEMVFVDAPFACERRRRRRSEPSGSAGGDGDGDGDGEVVVGERPGGGSAAAAAAVSAAETVEEEEEEKPASSAPPSEGAAPPGPPAAPPLRAPPVDPGRAWWFDGEVGDAAYPPPRARNGVGGVGARRRPVDGPRYVGLDASILHLRQIWSKNWMSAPFSGAVGFGQGAAVAAMLPLLRSQAGGDGEFGGGEGGGDPSMMFEGLGFVVLVDGHDIVSPPSSGGGDEDGRSESWFDDEDGDGGAAVRSLHVHAEGDGRAAALARRYGPHARVHAYELPPTAADVDGADRLLDRRGGDAPVRLRRRTVNAIGRFLVEQKNRLRRAAPRSGDPSRQLVARTRLELAEAERRTAGLVASTVAANPPRALMAMICPDAVGGWRGPKDRNAEDGGGAPCPGEFALREEDRPTGGGDDNDASREQPETRYP